VRYGISYADVAELVLTGHEHRRRNRGSGDWRLRSGRLVVIYNWPDGDEVITARVVTVWFGE
jgi:mRNA-degrading endonuclease RelE of RelBE toxin-antitoxin system